MLGHFGDAPAVKVLLKLTRAPIPTDNLQSLCAGVSLVQRMPYSGAEYGYYSAALDVSVAPALSVDVIAPHAVAQPGAWPSLTTPADLSRAR